jgi:hypothetical protein
MPAIRRTVAHLIRLLLENDPRAKHSGYRLSDDKGTENEGLSSGNSRFYGLAPNRVKML